MEIETVETCVAETMFIVRVVTKNGTFSVAYKDAARALRAVSDFHESGFSDVGIYDVAWRRLSFAEVREAVAEPRPADAIADAPCDARTDCRSSCATDAAARPADRSFRAGR